MGSTGSLAVTKPTAATVVVPNLDNARFIGETLDSIASQGVAGLEVIIVDGRSSDGSVEIIQEWADRNGARWVSEPDSGQAEAINKGFRMAQGDIITWINSDDLLHPDAVRRVLSEFSRDPDLEFLWGFCLEIDAAGKPTRILNPIVRPSLSDLQRVRNFVPQPASWYRRELLNRFGYLDESYTYSFDYEFFLRFAGNTNARFIPEILAMFRVHPSSKTVSQPNKFFPESWRAFRQHGGSIRSAFLLDYARDMWLSPIWRALTWPLRAAIRAGFKVRPGTRVRP